MSVAGKEGGNHEINFAKRIAAGDIVRIQGPAAQDRSRLPNLSEGSPELRIAHCNLHNIRVALARLTFRPR
jgi:hypothetical protein